MKMHVLVVCLGRLQKDCVDVSNAIEIAALIHFLVQRSRNPKGNDRLARTGCHSRGFRCHCSETNFLLPCSGNHEVKWNPDARMFSPGGWLQGETSASSVETGWTTY
jgi:hypothetical protein